MKLFVKRAPDSQVSSTRDSVESVVVAIILALLFRGFIVEAFVIPTGSMAEGLHGRHMDVDCPECGFQYQTTASDENADEIDLKLVTTGKCPICRHVHRYDRDKPNERSFSGDRILVNKLSYVFGDPQRWDVIVFKFPGNATQNYIKRLIGLPGEQVRIFNGDIYTRPLNEPESQFVIARKPAAKQLTMMHKVHDSEYRSRTLNLIRYPYRWRKVGFEKVDKYDGPWSDRDGNFPFVTDGSHEGDQFINYYHIPCRQDWWDEINRRLAGYWEAVESGDMTTANNILQRSELVGRIPHPQHSSIVLDFVAYNNYSFSNYGRKPDAFIDSNAREHVMRDKADGVHWVGDLCVEADIDVDSDSGELVLQIIEGMVTHQCRIDVATGTATLVIDDGRQLFTDADGNTSATVQGTTSLDGPGSYNFRFSNFDDELRLWVNDSLVEFDTPATFIPREAPVPNWTKDNPGDKLPLGIASNGLAMKVNNARVYRDVYYIAQTGHSLGSDYQPFLRNHGDFDYLKPGESREQLTEEELAYRDRKRLFDSRADLILDVHEDHFLPLGDNSQQSSDGRGWSANQALHRRLLIGEALMVYWPHGWRYNWTLEAPVIPNFKQFRVIR